MKSCCALLTSAATLIAAPLLAVQATGNAGAEPPSERSVFLLPYFLGNGETGIYFAYSRDGFAFEWMDGGEVVLSAPEWGEESLTRDPSLLLHDGTFHVVWTTSWTSRSIGYASSQDLVRWGEPRKIDIWVTSPTCSTPGLPSSTGIPRSGSS
jgi:hypothetical protein